MDYRSFFRKSQVMHKRELGARRLMIRFHVDTPMLEELKANQKKYPTFGLTVSQ